MEHIAVVVLCHRADKVSLRTIDQCVTHFGANRVFALDYGSDDSFPLHASLDENDFHAVNYVHMKTHDKHKALERFCTSEKLQCYSHVLLVDNQVGARIELLQDGLRMEIDIPTCAYFAHDSLPPPESGASSSSQAGKANWLASFLRKKAKANNRFQGQRYLKPTFAEERNEHMPNHFMDLWKRSTLLLHLRNEIGEKNVMTSSFCSLQQALARSTPCL